MAEQPSATARKRKGRTDRLQARVNVLDKTLIEAWRWSTFDGKNVEALRAILLKADPDANVHATLDDLLGDLRG